MNEMSLGAQLYTLRDYIQNEKDLEFCLKKVAEIGYKTVQVSGVGPIKPKRIRELCDENGLKIVITHTDPNRILYDTKDVILENEIMGCDYIGLGGMPPRYCTKAWVEHFAMDYKEPAKQIAAAGKKFMYHHHGFDFQKFGDKRMLEILLEGFTQEEMGITLDTYWVQFAGCDVLQWLHILKERIDCVHLKDLTMKSGVFDNIAIMSPVGEGNINFQGIIDTLKELKCTKHILVEQDICYDDPFVCLTKSYKNIQKML